MSRLQLANHHRFELIGIRRTVLEGSAEEGYAKGLPYVKEGVDRK